MAIATEKQTSKAQTIEALQKAYLMEMETVANYLADSINLDGLRAEEAKKSFAQDVQEELGHARRLAERIKQLGGFVPGSAELEFNHSHLDSTAESTDVERVIRGAIEDEQAAIEHYRQIIQDTEGDDYVTQDLCVQLLADEEHHLTQLNGYLKEYMIL